MQCECGGEVTFTACEPGYRLRIAVETQTVSVILSAAEVQRLLARIREVLDEDPQD